MLLYQKAAIPRKGNFTGLSPNGKTAGEVTALMRRYTTAGDTEDNWKYAAITNVFNPAIPGIVAA